MISCNVSHVLIFLQKLLDKGCAPFMFKVYVAAIAGNHSLRAGQLIGRNDLIVKFLKGAQWLSPPHSQTVPSWDIYEDPTLSHSADLWPLLLKTPLPLDLALVKRVGDSQALSVSTSCLEFGSNDCKVALKPRRGYVPKVLSQGPNLLCPVSALRVYLEHSSLFRPSEQLFVCFGSRHKGLPATNK